MEVKTYIHKCSFDQTRMRSHLVKWFRNSKLTDFLPSLNHDIDVVKTVLSVIIINVI